MDRTREFQSVVFATEIAQPPYSAASFYTVLAEKYEEIAVIVGELEKTTAYEAFRMQGRLGRAYELVRAYKAVPIGSGYEHGDSQRVVQALQSIVQANALRWTLRLNDVSRKVTRRSASVAAEEAVPRREEKMQPLLEEEQMAQTPVSVRDMTHERRRIVRSISEIGNVVEDISIHVRLQEESLRRIDETLLKSERREKQIIGELWETWDAVRGNRRFMLQFFGAWGVLFVLAWIAKRHFK